MARLMSRIAQLMARLMSRIACIVPCTEIMCSIVLPWLSIVCIVVVLWLPGMHPGHPRALGALQRVVGRLVEGGADLNVQTELGRTPVMEAARKGHKDVVQLLIDHGADVLLKNKAASQGRGRTTGSRPLQHACTACLHSMPAQHARHPHRLCAGQSQRTALAQAKDPAVMKVQG